MTALKPIESRRVKGVASERYPLNTKCARPDCNEDTADPHHAWPRSSIGNDSWFVEIEEGHAQNTKSQVIPHVTGLCRAHHDDVEQHRAWIKLEDGVFVWYDRGRERPHLLDYMGDDSTLVKWEPLGPLDPQPAGREKAHKPKRKRLKGQARRQRMTVSIRVPKDEAEDGAGLLNDAIELLEAKLGHDPARPPYYTILDGLNYAILNSDESDFR